MAQENTSLDMKKEQERLNDQFKVIEKKSRKIDKYKWVMVNQLTK